MQACAPQNILLSHCLASSLVKTYEYNIRASVSPQASKLLEDKKSLEVKVVEVQGTLDKVQNQRNELRQQLKEAKAAATELERKLREVRDAFPRPLCTSLCWCARAQLFSRRKRAA